ncbi:hypothetical protein HMP0721_1930 [Pseudoramibacter alactolyticus ATCC 23263]|uniref:Uncharacterized protein n=1 Tax=Pseudoramibacter alactolyticus ATCC 23263 TaxID=887929 RepID=E6MIU5_9FIRM|nr:hypothetical protein [Pseudoramibacter alactolyticus]EFV00970.1 hypothetical protein HMP0721_1930 [Pseudoramibacter alactolyticus ATCC 23263]
MVDFYRLSELVHRKDRNGTGSFALFIACTGKDGGKSPKKAHTQDWVCAVMMGLCLFGGEVAV